MSIQVFWIVGQVAVLLIALIVKELNTFFFDDQGVLEEYQIYKTVGNINAWSYNYLRLARLASQ
jgi:hypothetical protein